MTQPSPAPPWQPVADRLRPVLPWVNAHRPLLVAVAVGAVLCGLWWALCRQRRSRQVMAARVTYRLTPTDSFAPTADAIVASWATATDPRVPRPLVTPEACRAVRVTLSAEAETMVYTLTVPPWYAGSVKAGVLDECELTEVEASG